jgi:hypothetical protein
VQNISGSHCSAGISNGRGQHKGGGMDDFRWVYMPFLGLVLLLAL